MKTVEQVPEYIRSLIPYEPGKPIEEVEREYGIANSVKLASNENPLGPSPKALAAIRAEARSAPSLSRRRLLLSENGLAKKLGVAPEKLIFGNGSNEIIELAARTFLRPGDEAVMADQAFVVYQLIVQAVGGKSKAGAAARLTPMISAAIADAVTPRTRMVFLANPNNPTGTIFRRAEWEEFLDKDLAGCFADRRRSLLRVRRRTRTIPIRFVITQADRAMLTLRTFSKLYGLAGLRIGYGVAPKEIDRHDAAGAPAVQRQRGGAVGGAGGAG